MNYNIVIDNGNFRPFDYSLALQTINDYNTGYEKSLAVYDKISQTLGDLASAVNGSTRAKALYDEYQNRFNTAVELFSNGMDINTARELGALRNLYGTKIRLLEKANEAMVKEAERRRAEKDPTMMYLDIGTLDDYMDNPNRTLSSYSGNKLTNDVASLAKYVGLTMVDKKNHGRLDAYNKNWLMTKGFNPNSVNKAISEVRTGGIDAVTDPIYKNILQNIMQTSGIYGWADENTKRRAEIAAANGLYGGIGESSMGTYEDYASKKATDYQYKIKEMNAEIEKQRIINAIKNGSPDDPNNEARDGFSLLDANGASKSLVDTINSLLSTSKKAFGATYFLNGQVGKHFANPMKIYEAYLKFEKDHPKPIMYPEMDANEYMRELERREKAEVLFKKSYGITSILTKQQYEDLKALGYSADDNTGWNPTEAAKRQKKLAQNNFFDSVNLSDIKHWEAERLNHLKSLKNTFDSTNNVLFTFNSDGSVGDSVDLSEMTLNDESTLNNIYYSVTTPNMLALSITDNGTTSYYYGNPASIDATMAKIIEEASNDVTIANKIKDDKIRLQHLDNIQKETTAKLRAKVRAFNKQRSNTDSNI